MSVNPKPIKKPFISIIIPCYNVAKYIFKGLESISNQSYSSWECIVVNDGSTDNTETEIEKWTKKDKRFQLISQVNKGVSAARNAGLKQAKGDCIYFFDPDDLIVQDCLENLIELFHDNIDVVIGKNAEVYGQTTEINKVFEHGITPLKELKKTNFIELTLFHPILVVCWNNLYNAKFIFSNNLTFKEGIVHEDELWVFETLYLAKNIIFNSDVTYYYNVGNKYSITKNYSFNNLKCYITVLDEIFNNYYLKENKQNKLIIGTYILKLQITITAGFFRFIKKNKKLTYKDEGAMLIKNHLNACYISEYINLNPAKSNQFNIFIRYGRANPEAAFKLIRNTNKKNILKFFETSYLKYTYRNKLT